jgi:hypothetical protein
LRALNRRDPLLADDVSRFYDYAGRHHALARELRDRAPGLSRKGVSA